MLKITRLNRFGNEVDAVINVEDITGIVEIELEDTPLYNNDGDLVETKKNDSIYEIRFNNFRHIIVKKPTYTKLLAELKVKTL